MKNPKKLLVIVEILIIFTVTTIIYLANQTTITSGDCFPNTLLAFNFLENHRLDFSNFRDSYLASFANGYFFIESNQGQLTSGYPIGVSIVTFPLYLIFYFYLKLAHIALNITDESFEVYRLLFEKVAATIVTSLSVVLFYLSSRLKFARKVAYISTFIYAFATSTWTIGSQGLWQHGSSNLVLLGTFYCLLLANRSKDPKFFLLAAGLFAGLLPGIRPTNAIFSIITVVYTVTIFKFRSALFLLGLILSSLPSIIWNWYNFGNLTGGYSVMYGGTLPYIFTANHFFISFMGILFSPSRGLLVFSPILVFSIYGAYQILKLRSYTKLNQDEQLIGIMTVAGTILFVSYCFCTFWDGGHTYGPRYMTDLMPIMCYLINYSFAQKNYLGKFNQSNIFVYCLLFISLFNQIVGVFAYNGQYDSYWNSRPLGLWPHPHRVWQIPDNQIERHTRSLFYKINKPDLYTEEYKQGLKGVIEEVREVIIHNPRLKMLEGKMLETIDFSLISKGVVNSYLKDTNSQIINSFKNSYLKDTNSQIINSFKAIKPRSDHILAVKIRNTGAVNWYGYAEGMELGETRIRTRFLNPNGKTISESVLFISGNQIKPQQETYAIGEIQFPNQPGKYTLILDFISEGVTEFANSKIPAYKIDVIVNGVAD
jgi:hypothetical protein